MKKPTLRIAGKPQPFSASELAQGWKYSVRPGGWIVFESPEGVRCRMMMTEVRGRVSAQVGGRPVFGEIQQDRAHSQALGAEGGGDSDLAAQFPGKVRKILVTKDQKVKAGDALVLVEAMKMEFTIKAPFDGKVKSILVVESQQLSPGDRFMDLEAEEGNGGS